MLPRIPTATAESAVFLPTLGHYEDGDLDERRATNRTGELTDFIAQNKQ
jgi:hypothetical protein